MSADAADLMRAAVSRVGAGDLSGARAQVEAVADHWAAADRPAEQARCLRLAADLARHEGRPDLAAELAARAVALAPALASAALPPALATASRVLVDAVARLSAAGRDDLAGRLAADGAAAVGDDHEAASELELLAAARAAGRRDLAAARAHAGRARAEALAGRSALAYSAAASALTELALAVDDRVAAYESLAVGWVTLRDLLGATPARAAFEPQLLALRERWGPAGFAAVKSAYEAKAGKP
jgi:hypothetical protein